MKSEPDDLDPVAFDGPEIIGSTGCVINWKKGLFYWCHLSVLSVNKCFIKCMYCMYRLYTYM